MKAYFPGISIIILLAAAIGFGQTAAATTVTADMRKAANEYYQNKDWQKAADAYQTIAEAEPKNAGASYRLGLCRLNSGQNAEAVMPLERAMELSPNSVFALALARAYARTGSKAKAFETIDKSAKLGGIPPASLTDEKDFAAFQQDAEFKELIHKSDLAVNPCKAKPEYRQFDFWIGEWDVRNTQGVAAGSSSVQLILGECTIFENWTSGAGSSGKSFNIYDVNDGKWHQTWVSDKATFTHYIGGMVDGSMVLTADTVIGNKKGLARMTFSKLPSGEVRQHGENSFDEGKTWTTSFDLIYSRRK